MDRIDESRPAGIRLAARAAISATAVAAAMLAGSGIALASVTDGDCVMGGGHVAGPTCVGGEFDGERIDPPPLP